MNIRDFRKRLESGKIKIDKSQVEGSVVITEQRFDSLTGERLPDGISNVRIDDIRKEKQQVIDAREKQIKSYMDQANVAIHELDFIIVEAEKVTETIDGE